MRHIDIIGICVCGGRGGGPIESMSQVLETSPFIEGSRQWVTSDIVDRFLRSEYFTRQAEVLVSSRESDTRETRKDD